MIEKSSKKARTTWKNRSLNGLVHEVAISSVRKAHCDVDQHVKRRSHVASPVLAKDEFIEVAPQVRLAHAVIGPERPSFEIGEDAMDPRQQDVRRHRADDFSAMEEAGEAAVAGKAIAQERRAGRDGARDEATDAGGGEIGERRESDTSWQSVGR